MLESEAVARLNGAADAEVERETEYMRTLVRGEPSGAICRTVVDHHDVETRVEGADLVDHAAHGLLLVERRDDRDAPQLADPSEHGVARRHRHSRELSHGRPPVIAGP